MKKIIIVLLCATLIVNFFGFIIPNNASGYITHSQIYINGNAGFTSANGVTGGSGTQSDPYIIEGWDISAFFANGIEIRNTDAYFIIRNCYVYDGRYNFNNGFCLQYVQNGLIENTISLNNNYGIWLSYSSYNNIYNNSASNNLDGIYLYHSSNNNISNNNVSNNYCGIYLTSSSNNNISNNNVSNNNYGIYLTSSSNNNIYNNNVSNNNYGIWLSYSSNNNIYNNSASNNGDGICLYSGSSNNNISNNSINSNNEYGIYLQLYSSYNTLVFNNISYNGCSAEIYDSNCENNTLHHNNFISGTVINVVDNGVNTKWDDGHGEGNHWSNYTGADDGSGGRTASDGVGDTNIPHMGLDNYPLMEPAGRRNMPPVISSVNVPNITANSAMITWITDENSDSRVNYSINTDLSSNSTKYNSTVTTSHSITLTGLSPGTTYYFELSSTDTYGNTATDTNNSNYYRFKTSEDTTPPVISSVSVSDITDNSVTITWITDEPGDSRVNYSINEDLSSNLTKYDPTMTTNHSITLTNLSSNTIYYFEVSSNDTYGNTATNNNNTYYYIFTTEAPTTEGLGFSIFDYWWVILLVIIIVAIIVIVVISRRKKGKTSAQQSDVSQTSETTPEQPSESEDTFEEKS